MDAPGHCTNCNIQKAMCSKIDVSLSEIVISVMKTAVSYDE